MSTQFLISENGTSPYFNVSSSHQLPSAIFCFTTTKGSIIFTIFTLANCVFLFPPCLYILYLGFLQLWQQRSSSTAAVTSPSESVTYHTVVMSLFGVLGYLVTFSGIYLLSYITILWGFGVWTFSWYGETFFHLLTCLERYLAVVHPIVYLSLKSERGTFIRNISIWCVWVLCLGRRLLIISEKMSCILDICGLIISMIIITVCTASVLCILIRPGPGKQGRDWKRVDQTKQKALFTIMAVLAVLLLRFTWSLAVFSTYITTDVYLCLYMDLGIWLNLPSSLVLPLLFLHRGGKLACCK